MENNKNKKSVKFQGDMLNFYDFIQVFVFITNHHLKIRPLSGHPTHSTKTPVLLRASKTINKAVIKARKASGRLRSRGRLGDSSSGKLLTVV